MVAPLPRRREVGLVHRSSRPHSCLRNIEPRIVALRQTRKLGPDLDRTVVLLRGSELLADLVRFLPSTPHLSLAPARCRRVRAALT